MIYPPVDISSFSLTDSPDDFYLIVSPLVPYKSVDLAIGACNLMKRPLVVIGEGEESNGLRKAAGPNITFLGYQPDEVVRDHYRRCRAFLFPGEEDIGLTPIEVQASGRPVIAFGRGGALETVDGYFVGEPPRPEVATGIFFGQQSVESLVEAMRVFESVEARFSPVFIRAHAQRFDVSRFKKEMFEFIENKLAGFNLSPPRHRDAEQSHYFQTPPPASRL